MKLSNIELRFIDNYLKASGVKHFDIRMELTDHIASAVEEKMQREDINFHIAFKNYMIWNKRELIKKNKYSWRFLITLIFRFLKGFLHSTLILFAILGYAVTEYFISFEKTEILFLEIINLLNLILLVPLAFMFFLSYKRRYAEVESMWAVCVLFYLAFQIIVYMLKAYCVSQLPVFKIILVMYICCILVYMRVAFLTKKEYDKIYK